MRYRFQAGSNYVYAVQVDASQEDYVETVTGHVVYTVRATEGDKATVTYRSQLTPQRRPKPGKTMPISLPFGPGSFWSELPSGAFGARPEMRIDSAGQILEHSESSTALPQALGDLDRLVFERLSPDARSSWELSSDCSIVYKTVVRLSPMSRLGRQRQTTYPATETAKYTLEDGAEKNAVRIRKHYELKTLESIEGEPCLQLTGDGTITFDTVAGLPQAMEFKGAFIERTENTTRRTPLTLTYKRLEGEARDQALRPPAPPKVELEEMSASEMKDTLAELQAASWGRRQLAANRLARSKPVEPRDAVVKALIAALDDSTWAVRQCAAKALANWGSAAAVPPLIKKLDDSEFSVRWAAMEALGQLKDERAAAPLARRLAVSQDSTQAATALKALGPQAEDAVLATLKTGNPAAQREACNVLKAIGTKKSLPALQALVKGEDRLAALVAKQALQSVEARISP